MRVIRREQADSGWGRRLVWVVAVPSLPLFYLLAASTFHLDLVDKVIILLLTLLDIGLLFPDARDWVTQFARSVGCLTRRSTE